MYCNYFTIVIYPLFTPRRNLLFVIFVPVSVCKNARVTVIAVNMETTIPSPSINAKPRMIEFPKNQRIKQVISEETFESRIEDHARSNPV